MACPKLPPPQGNFTFDFRRLTFTGPARYSIATLDNCCLFLLGVIWLAHAYILPIFAGAAGGTLVKNLSKLFSAFKGGKAP
jgi:hypothetical protein